MFMSMLFSISYRVLFFKVQIMRLRLDLLSFVYRKDYELLKIDSFRFDRFTLICCINVVKPLIIANAFVYLPGTNCPPAW